MLYTTNEFKENSQNYGFREAIVLDRFIYFTASNILNNVGRYDNKTWVQFEGGYNMLISDSHFPGLTYSQIRWTLTKLRKQDCIEASQAYNKGYDRTYSYSLNSKLFSTQITKKITEIKNAQNRKENATSPVAAPKFTTPNTTKKTTANVPSQPTSKAQKLSDAEKAQKIKKDMETIDLTFRALSQKFNETVEGMLEVGQTVFQDYYYKAFNQTYKMFDYTNYAVKEIIRKEVDILQSKNIALTKENLIWNLDWLFYTFFQNDFYKKNMTKFTPSYINNDNVFEQLKEAKSNLIEKHFNKNHHWRRPSQTLILTGKLLLKIKESNVTNHKVSVPT